MSTSPVNASIMTSFSGLASGINTSAIISNMVAFAQQPINQLNSQIAGYDDQLTAYQTLNADLLSLQTASSTLSMPTTFQQNSANSSNTSVATITATTGAAISNHTLTVNQIAQAQQLITSAQSSANNALGQTGTIIVNGKSVTISATNSLNDIANNINAANAGVTATVTNVGNNQYRMTIGSAKTGLVHTISISDSSGSVLNSLGIATGASGIRQEVGANGAGSIVATSAGSPLGTQLGYTTGAPSGAIQISNGGTGDGNVATISINLATDSLNDIANKINGAGISGITANVVDVPDDNGNTIGQQLQIVSSNGKDPVFTDNNNVLATLGIVQNSTIAANQTTAAQDASFSYDGVAITRSYNTVGDLIPGATVTLLSATPAATATDTTPTPATTNLSITQDTSDIVTSIQNYVTAYNNIQTFITAQNTFTPPTDTTSGTQASSPALMGSSVLMSVQQQLSSVLSNNVGSTTLASIGISTSSTGQLTVDSTELNNALQSDASSVQGLFGSSGATTNPEMAQFITATSSSSNSSGNGYNINISQPATQSTALAATAQTSPSVKAETLTFSGNNFPAPVSITLKPGNTLAETVAQINNTSSLSDYVIASIDPTTNALKINSRAYGANSIFNVTSDQAGSGSNSGIGLNPTYTSGADVAGTINGETASGNGQYLIGNQKNGKANGVEVMITGTTTGSYGQVSVTNGVANSTNSTLTQLMDPTNGALTMAQNAINTEIDTANTQITNDNDEVNNYTSYLQSMFSAMETQISGLQSQGSAFASQMTSLLNAEANGE